MNTKRFQVAFDDLKELRVGDLFWAIDPSNQEMTQMKVEVPAKYTNVVVTLQAKVLKTGMNITLRFHRNYEVDIYTEKLISNYRERG